MRPSASGPILVLFSRPLLAVATDDSLEAALGAEAARAVRLALLRDSIELLRRVSPAGVRAAIAWSEQSGDEDPASLGEPLEGIQTLTLQGDDPGQRLSSCIAALLAAGHDRVAIIGPGTPSLPVEVLKKAFELLRDRDLVFGPSADGGYYLIGARSVIPEIFRGIPWGTDRVLSETMRILKIFGFPRVLLPQMTGAERPAGLERLRGTFAALPEADTFLRHTRTALRALPQGPGTAS